MDRYSVLHVNGFDLEVDMDLKLDKDLELDLEPDLGLDLDLGCDLDLDLDRGHDRDFDLAFDRAFDFAVDRDLDLTVDRDLDLTVDRDLELTFDLDLTFDRDRGLDLVPDRAFDLAFDPDLDRVAPEGISQDDETDLGSAVSNAYGADVDDDIDPDTLVALDRRAHRALARRHRDRPRPRRPVPAEVAEQIDTGDDVFVPGHAVSENEQAMLQDALGVFYRDNVIVDVLARVKGGKEANVYCCQAHPSTGLDLLAAKIYRPRAHRTMRNDAIYKEGRLMLDEAGKGIVRDARKNRAIAKKTAFGRELMTFTWIEHEYDVMQMLHADGADVPRPIGHVGSAILMEYYGEINRPAPTLNAVHLETCYQAELMLERLLWLVEQMLRHDRVHGDLSAYNVLYWDGHPVVIDFPQAVVASSNPNAEWLLARDVARLCQYFERYGSEVDGEAVASELWGRFENARL